MTVSCQGQKLASLTGIQLITGTSFDKPGYNIFGGKKETQKVDGEPVAIIAFVVGIVGLGFSFMKSKKSSIIPAGLGLLGLILLLIIKVRLDEQVNKIGGAAMGVIQIDYGVGYWLTFIFYLLATGLNGFVFWQRKTD